MHEPPPPAATAPRRLVILAEGNIGFHHGKTAVGVIRYGPDDVVAVIDSSYPLAAAADAVRRMEGHGLAGKVVITV